MSLFKMYIWPYFKQYRWMMISTILLGVLTVLGASMLTFTSGYLITRASQRPENILMLYVPIVAVRTFGISRAVTRYLERLLGHNAVLKILSKLRVKLYGMLEPQALFIRSRFQTGDLFGTLADDIEHLQDVYIRTIFPSATALFLFLYSVVALAMYDWVFALWIALCLSIIVFVYPLLSLYLLKKRQVELKEQRSRLYRKYTDALFGLTDWIISGRKQTFIDQFSEESRSEQKNEKKLAYWNQSRTFGLQVWSGIIVILVGIWSGLAAGDGLIAPTYIAAFTLVALPILEGLIPLSHAVDRIPAYTDSLERIDRIRRQMPAESRQKHTLETESPAIEVRGVTYSYATNVEPAVKGMSLSIPYGKKIALLGKSGAGKSTLLQLLQGAIVPESGEILINGKHPDTLGDGIYDVMGILNQKPYLFATTVRNNIRLGRMDATDEEIDAVIKQVKLDQYIDSLPQGADTQMEESGQRFSGGERQRIALARILLKNTPVVVLDEPTVGLDPETEHNLLETIFTSLKDKTVIWVTHHLAGMEKMDDIIFLDEGKIALRGTHDQLLRTNDRYQNLFALDRGY